MWKRCMCFIWLMVVLGSTAYGAFDPLKDAALIRRFCEAVREADARVANAMT